MYYISSNPACKSSKPIVVAQEIPNKKIADLPEDQLQNISFKDKSDITILLLGDKIVGKSFFINSLANYLTHINFETAQKEKLIVLTPACFAVGDKKEKKQMVFMTVKDNSHFGSYSTSYVRLYNVPIGKTKSNIRIIDTPGWSKKKNAQNIVCENILKYISGLHHLHAVCIFQKYKSKQGKDMFSWYLNQLLNQLDKSIINNLIFIITYANEPNYSPQVILKKTIDEFYKNNQVQIPLDKNVFCFDNEAIRYLAATKNGVPTKQKETKVKRKWTQCILQTYR